MKVEYISPIVNAAMAVIRMLLGAEPTRGALAARPQLFTSQQINVVCGVTGQIEGQVIFGMSAKTADQIAARMIGQPITQFDALAASAIAELGNMISGNSASGLAECGFICDITPPTIIRGTNLKISTSDVPALMIPFEIGEYGIFEITVSLRERTTRKAA